MTAALLGAGEAHADDTHYQDFVVGGRAVVLGGAFTSIADDPSGIYFNPAGIADVRHTSLQLSSSLYGFERGTIDERLGLPVPGVENLDVQFTDLIIVPSSAGFVKTFGPRGADGLAKHSYGISVLVPSYRSFAASAGDESATYVRRVTDRELWSGFGYAAKPSSRLRLGVSAYYILRSVVDQEEVTVTEVLPNNQGEKFQTVDNDISFITGNVVAIAGAKYRLSEMWSLGLSVQSPSLRVHSKVNLRFSASASDPTASGGPVSRFERLDIQDARAETGHAGALRAGISYQRPYKYTLSLDASYHLPITYTLVQVDEAYRDRMPFNPRVARHAVLNLNGGVEYLVVREVSVGAGMFTDFSSAPSISSDPAADQPPRVDLLGLTMALGYYGLHSLSRLGVVYTFGTGSDVIPKSDIDRALGSAQEFRRVSYSQSFFYVFLSSTFRY